MVVEGPTTTYPKKPIHEAGGPHIGHVENAAIEDGLLRLAFGPKINNRHPGIDLLTITPGNNHMPSAPT